MKKKLLSSFLIILFLLNSFISVFALDDDNSESMVDNAPLNRSYLDDYYDHTFWIRDNSTNNYILKTTTGGVAVSAFSTSMLQKWQFLKNSDGTYVILNADTNTLSYTRALSLNSDNTVTTVEYNIKTAPSSNIKWYLSQYDSTQHLYIIRQGTKVLINNSGTLSVSTVYYSATKWKFCPCSNIYTFNSELDGYASKINNSNLINYMNCYAYALMLYNECEPQHNFFSNPDVTFYSWHFDKLQPGQISGNVFDIVDLFNETYCTIDNSGNNTLYTINNKFIAKYYREIKERVESDIEIIYGTTDNIFVATEESRPFGADWKKIVLYITPTFYKVTTGSGNEYYTFDYHWYVEDSDEIWYHKPGTTPVRNVDNSNNIITNPDDADRGDYEQRIAYIYIRCSSELKKVTYNSTNDAYSVNTFDQGDSLMHSKMIGNLSNTNITYNSSIDYGTTDIWKCSVYHSLYVYDVYFYFLDMYYNIWRGKQSFNISGTPTQTYESTGYNFVNYSDFITDELDFIKEDKLYAAIPGSDETDIPQDIDYYEFMVTSSGTYEIYTEYYNNTTFTDTYGHLYENDTLLQSNNDGGNGLNFKITVVLSPNVLYRVSVSGYNTNVYGKYKFKITRL